MKKIIDILAIVLPALIILLGILRVFVRKTKGVNGLTMLFAILLLLAGLVRFYFFPDRGSSHDNGPKPPPIAVSKHSDIFNQSLENVLTGYYKLTESFSGGDSNSVNQSASQLKTALDSFKVEELKVDDIIYQTALQPYENAKSELASVLTDPSLSEKRNSFNIFSNELFSLLSIVRYDLARIYWLECDRAFGEGKAGNWLSKNEKSTSPYEPKDCAEVKTSINFVAADTTKKANTPQGQ